MLSIRRCVVSVPLSHPSYLTFQPLFAGLKWHSKLFGPAYWSHVSGAWETTSLDYYFYFFWTFSQRKQRRLQFCRPTSQRLRVACRSGTRKFKSTSPADKSKGPESKILIEGRRRTSLRKLSRDSECCLFHPPNVTDHAFPNPPIRLPPNIYLYDVCMYSDNYSPSHRH